MFFFCFSGSTDCIQKKVVRLSSTQWKGTWKSTRYVTFIWAPNRRISVTVLGAKASASSSKDFALLGRRLPNRGIWDGKWLVPVAVFGVAKKMRESLKQVGMSVDFDWFCSLTWESTYNFFYNFFLRFLCVSFVCFFFTECQKVSQWTVIHNVSPS